jgi:peptidoglycan/LPS O-acetylase OafA/YrhL
LLFGVGLRSFLITHYPDEVWTGIYYPTYTRLDGLLTGVALAIVRVFRPQWWSALQRRGHMLLFTGVVLVGSVVWMFRGNDLGNDTGPARWGVIVGFPLLSLGLGCITASGVSHNGLLARVKVPGAELLATLAFTLYLTHKPVAHIAMQHLPRIALAQGPASWLLYAVSCLVAAWLLHVGVERPFLRLRDRNVRRRSRASFDLEAREDPAL